MQDVAEGDAVERGVGERQGCAVIDLRLDVERLEEAILDIDRGDVGDAEQILHGLGDDAGAAADVEHARVHRVP